MAMMTNAIPVVMTPTAMAENRATFHCGLGFLRRKHCHWDLGDLPKLLATMVPILSDISLLYFFLYQGMTMSDRMTAEREF